MRVGSPHDHEYVCTCGNRIPAFMVEQTRQGTQGSVVIRQSVLCTRCNPHGAKMARREKEA